MYTVHFTQEILPLLPKKLPTPYSRNLRVPTDRLNKLRGFEQLYLVNVKIVLISAIFLRKYL